MCPPQPMSQASEKLSLGSKGSGQRGVAVGVCVGVQEYQQSTARATGGALDPMLSAWYTDYDDLHSAPHTFREGTEHQLGTLALEAVQRDVARLFREGREHADYDALATAEVA